MKPAKLSKFWPVFDSGGYGDATSLTLNVVQKPPQVRNPLLFNITEADFSLSALHQSCGLVASWKQTQLNRAVPNDDVTRKVFSSVSRQLRIINAHFQNSMFKYKYPRVTRQNVLLESSVRLPAMHYSLTMKAIRFQPTPRRVLPCYGNLELPFKIKEERATGPQIFASIGRSVGMDTLDVKYKVESNVKVENDVKLENDVVKVEKEKDRDNRER